MQQAALYRRQTANNKQREMQYPHRVVTVFLSEIWASALADLFDLTVFYLRNQRDLRENRPLNT